MSESESEAGPKRRTFLRNTALLTTSLGVPSAMGAAETENKGITAIKGIRAGHFTDHRRPTGCTVAIFEGGAVAGVDVRGAAPGTRETDLLNPVNTVQKVNAIVLSGGSAFGLDTATGVMHYLEEKGEGFKVGQIVVPIVPAAILFDLGVGDPKIRPDARAGYEACRSATDGPVPEGSVGAGAGATVGKLFGMKQAMKSGIGTACVSVGRSGLRVAAIVAVNAIGDVFDHTTGAILAGARKPDGSGFVNSMSQIMQGYAVTPQTGRNTTIGIVATNAGFDKAQATKIAQMAQDGLARSIRPAHTSFDGDTIFAACTGTHAEKVEVGMVGAIAAEVMANAVTRAVRLATGLPGLPAMKDLASGAP